MRALDSSRCRGCRCENRLPFGACPEPFRDAAVRWHSAVQLAGGDAVLVGHVAANDDAQPLDVEESVLQFEGSNVHSIRSMPRPRASLRCSSFRLRPTPLFAVLVQDPQHVAVKVHLAIALQAGDRETETDHPARRQTRQTPDRRSSRRARTGAKARSPRRQNPRLCAGFRPLLRVRSTAASRTVSRSRLCLASCQRASISSRVAPGSVFPASSKPAPRMRTAGGTWRWPGGALARRRLSGAARC